MRCISYYLLLPIVLFSACGKRETDLALEKALRARSETNLSDSLAQNEKITAVLEESYQARAALEEEIAQLKRVSENKDALQIINGSVLPLSEVILSKELDFRSVKKGADVIEGFEAIGAAFLEQTETNLRIEFDLDAISFLLSAEFDHTQTAGGPLAKVPLTDQIVHWCRTVDLAADFTSSSIKIRRASRAEQDAEPDL